MKFRVIERDEEQCVHDTGVFHSLGMRCIDAERMAKRYHLFESDPLHNETWHKHEDNENEVL